MQSLELAVAAFHDAVARYAEGDERRALEHARKALEFHPESPLLDQTARYLEAAAEGKDSHSVYSSAEAFSAFVDGGGNVPLYEAVSQALREVYTEYDALRLLDIGVGHGRALLPSLTPAIAHVTVVEPSPALLEKTEAALKERGVPFTSHGQSLQDFSATDTGERWPLAQATFSLQSIGLDDRLPMLAWLREHVDRLLIVEFDVPTFATLLEPAHVHSVARRYERGLAEYVGRERDLVAQGFLVPVMLGYFRAENRTNHEHSLEAWVEQLQAAGFATVRTRPLYDYWWSPAHLIDARSQSGAPQN